jgi:PKD repeat protein
MVLNTDFNANVYAKTAFIRALNQWKCKTNVNAFIDTTTTALYCDQIGSVNFVAFSKDNCSDPLADGVLGQAHFAFWNCASSPGKEIMTNFNILFDDQTNWSYDTVAHAGQIDFESVALHELGHLFGENHVLNAGEIMLPSIGSNTRIVTLNNSTDIASINDILNRSNTTVCSYTPHSRKPFICNQALDADFTADVTSGCSPLTVHFTNTSTGIPVLYKWDIGNNGTIDYTSFSPSYTFSTPGSYTIKLIVEDIYKKDSVIKTNYISTSPGPSVTLSTLQNVVCNNGNTGSLKANVTGGIAPIRYTWSGISQTTQTVTGLYAGTYTVTVSDTTHCAVTSAPVTITEPSPLSIAFTNTPSSGSNGSAKATVSGGTTPYTYSWNTNPIQTTQTASNLAPGTYVVTVKDKNQCMKTGIAVVGNLTGIREVEKQFEALDVYPNPASDLLNIRLVLKQPKQISLQLITLEGKTLQEKTLGDNRINSVQFNLNELASGTYILKIGTPDGDTFRKLEIFR